MTQIENKAKELVNTIYQPMGYLSGLNLNNKQMWAWASDIAVKNVVEIINAIKTTIGHCELSRLDLHECDLDIIYWERVIEVIKANR